MIFLLTSRLVGQSDKRKHICNHDRLGLFRWLKVSEEIRLLMPLVDLYDEEEGALRQGE